jgi:hypothetical protein
MGQGAAGFGLHSTSTNTIKSCALTDFVAEWTPTTLVEEEEGQPTDLPGNADSDDWVMYFDGSFRHQRDRGPGQNCDACQFHAKNIFRLAQALQTIPFRCRSRSEGWISSDPSLALSE